MLPGGKSVVWSTTFELLYNEHSEQVNEHKAIIKIINYIK